MAKSTSEELSIEELEAEIRRVELETKALALERAKEENEQWKAKKAEKIKRNQVTQSDLAADRRKEHAKTIGCRHRQGGFQDSFPKKGKGDPCVSAHKMPFGELRLQCNRCLLEVYEPNPAQRNERGYRDKYGRTWDEQKEVFDKLYEMFEEGGLHMGEGPQFTALTPEGIPFRPALV